MNHISRRHFNQLIGGLLTTTPLSLASFRLHQTEQAISKVLLLSGQNNHSWQRTTPLIEDILKESGLFTVELSITPPPEAAKEVWDTWRPVFAEYDVIVNNYFGDTWPQPVQDSFLSYIQEGGTCVVLHAANNAFEGWKPYEEMVGLLWRDNSYGERLYYDEEGKLIRVPAGEGPGAGHGKVHDWPITARDAQHPIMKGLPSTWLHAHDELYHGQRGPAQNMHILATAYSSEESGGTGKHEPMIWWIAAGKGKVLTFLPGHLWPTQPEDTSFQCVGLRTLLKRSTEWLATGQVTVPVPDNFPTAEQTSLKEI